MVEKGVIVKVNGEPSKFISNIVIVPKANGKLRVCLDATYLNKALKRKKRLTKLVRS